MPIFFGLFLLASTAAGAAASGHQGVRGGTDASASALPEKASSVGDSAAKRALSRRGSSTTVRDYYVTVELVRGSSLELCCDTIYYLPRFLPAT